MAADEPPAPAGPSPAAGAGDADLLDALLAQHPEREQAWRAREAGAWGFLAGQAVLAARRRLGRPLTDGERRAVWQALWDRLMLRARRA